MPNFVTFDITSNTFLFIPNIPQFHLGFYKITVILSDSRLKNEFSFSITVINEPPYFRTNPKDQLMKNSLYHEFFLPESVDDERLPYTTSVLMADDRRLPKYIKYSEG
jgi:hypothetical protein